MYLLVFLCNYCLSRAVSEISSVKIIMTWPWNLG